MHSTLSLKSFPSMLLNVLVKADPGRCLSLCLSPPAIDGVIFFFFFFFRILATINKLIVLPLFNACWVFSCFRNPPNSDNRYLMWARDHSDACALLLGVGRWQQVSTTFWTEKNSQVFLVLLMEFEPQGHRILSLRLCQLSHPVTQWRNVNVTFLALCPRV